MGFLVFLASYTGIAVALLTFAIMAGAVLTCKVIIKSIVKLTKTGIDKIGNCKSKK